MTKKILHCVTNCSDYEFSPKTCNILPLSLYFHVRSYLFMAKTFIENNNSEITGLICLSDTTRELRVTVNLKFQNCTPKWKICEQTSSYSSKNLRNCLPKDMDFVQIDGLKKKLLYYFYRYFDERFLRHKTKKWKVWNFTRWVRLGEYPWLWPKPFEKNLFLTETIIPTGRKTNF